jgi:uncharacterized protein
MTTTLERLRRLQSLRDQRKPVEPDLPETVIPQASELRRLSEVVPGAVQENDSGTCYLVTHMYALSEARGRHPLGELLNHAPRVFAPFHPNFALQQSHTFQRALFLDTETTGLGAGAGVYCFMVGAGSFEVHEDRIGYSGAAPELAAVLQPEQRELPTHFVVRQFFMRHPGEERALLAALADLCTSFELTVTFNGRTFDLPLLRARYSQNQRHLPERHRQVPIFAEAQPHLDLLPPARRLWRRRLQSCRLLNLEQQIVGHQRTEEDVPGYLIPLLYNDFVRNGHPDPIARIFYHNHEDIVTMVALAQLISGALQAAPEHQSTPAVTEQEWLALGECYERAQQWDAAEQAYRHALQFLERALERREAFAKLGALQKRQMKWEAAATTWQEWLTSVPGSDPTPFVELAKYCEWQVHDYAQAAMWCAWALHNLRNDPHRRFFQPQIDQLEHRLKRLERKQLGRPSTNDSKTDEE